MAAELAALAIKRKEAWNTRPEPVAVTAPALAAIAALIAEAREAGRREGCAWADAIDRWFVNWHQSPDWNAADPYAEINRQVAWEQSVALDPAVSEDACKLIERGRREGLEEAQDIAPALYMTLIGMKAIPCECGNGRIPTGGLKTGIDRYRAAIHALAKEPSHDR